MATLDTQTLEVARRGFRYLNKGMLFLWRLGLGGALNAGPPLVGRYMVLVHTGRKSGLKRCTPVNYAELDGDLYCVAGFGKMSDWYRNVCADGRVEVWLPDGWWSGEAVDITDTPNALDKMRRVLVRSGFAAYAAGIDPVTMPDDVLVAATSDYRLVRIHRVAARTGMGGPGDLAWVWPVATFGLLALLLARPRR
jgi:deazaflavin-dependent oxidoreductase (nitroreductase family)